MPCAAKLSAVTSCVSRAVGSRTASSAIARSASSMISSSGSSSLFASAKAAACCSARVCRVRPSALGPHGHQVFRIRSWKAAPALHSVVCPGIHGDANRRASMAANVTRLTLAKTKRAMRGRLRFSYSFSSALPTAGSSNIFEMKVRAKWMCRAGSPEAAHVGRITHSIMNRVSPSLLPLNASDIAAKCRNRLRRNRWFARLSLAARASSVSCLRLRPRPHLSLAGAPSGSGASGGAAGPAGAPLRGKPPRGKPPRARAAGLRRLAAC